MQHSNGYIIGFAAVVCVVCGFFVALAATTLKPLQDENVLLDRQKNVLVVAGLMRPGERIGADDVKVRFDESIRAQIITLQTGEPDETIDPNSFDQRRAAKDPDSSQLAPPNASKVLRLPKDALVYEVITGGEVDAVILPISGMGLWSVLHGYIALDSDARTIKGITYYEHGETPGLGGEVDNPRWKAGWVGRKAFDDRGAVKIEVKKGTAGPADEDPYHVDGLAGATITSRGVTNMLRFWLGEDGFGPYLDRYREQRGI